MWLGTISAIGSIIGIGRWGQESDKRGSRWVMSVAMIPMAGLSILWILAPIGGIQLFIWAALLYLVNGFLGSGLELAKTRAMVQAVPFESQAEGFTMAFYFQAIGGGIGGVLGGLIFNKLSENSGSFLGLSYRQLYLAFMQFLTLPVWLLSRNLRDRFSGGRELTNSDMPVNN